MYKAAKRNLISSLNFNQNLMSCSTCSTLGYRVMIWFLKKIFSFLGNPVSAIVTFNLVVVPSINKLMGYENPHHKRIKVKVR